MRNSSKATSDQAPRSIFIWFGCLHVHRSWPFALRDATIGASVLYSRAIALLALCSMLAACDDIRFPRDAEKTLETVLAQGEMTVAVADSPPWVTFKGEEEPQGVEADLIRAFADELGVVIEWKHLGAFAALEGLDRGDVDLAIGGFDRKGVTPVVGAAPSYAYFEEAFVIGARPDIAAAGDLEGQEVFVPRDLPVAELVRGKGSIPVEEWSDEVGLAALPHWLLIENDLRSTGIVLHRAQHVVAVRQGENAWLMRLERFLRRETDDIGARLRANAI